MAAVLAGIICGYALALIATPFAAMALIRARVNSEWLRRVVPPETPMLAWAFIMHTFWLMMFTGAGLLFGLFLYGLEDSRPEGGLGSPNGVFTIIVITISVIAILPVAVVVPRWRVPLLLSGLIFAATFGWAMPYLSLLGPDS